MSISKLIKSYWKYYNIFSSIYFYYLIIFILLNTMIFAFIPINLYKFFFPIYFLSLLMIKQIIKVFK